MLPFVAGVGKKGLPGLLSGLRWTRSLHSSAGSNKPAAPKAVPLSKLKDGFNDATSVAYLEDLEKRFNENPDSIDRTWASFFTNLGKCTHAPSALAGSDRVMMMPNNHLPNSHRSRCYWRGDCRGIPCVREGRNRLPSGCGCAVYSDHSREHEADAPGPLLPGDNRVWRGF